MSKPEKMNALVKTAKGKGLVEIREVSVPEIGDNEVLIEVKAAGICGTDLHIYNDKFPYWPPVILGHEFSGTIAEMGKNVTDWKIGDRVVGEPHTRACGKCWLCRTGNRQICPEKRSPGWGIDGCFAHYMKYPEPELLHKMPDTLSFEDAALVEPTANVVADVLERGAIKPVDFVVVIGPGPIGLLAAMAAKAGGAAQVVVIGTDADEGLRLPTARKLKTIDYVVNVNKEDPVSLVMDLTGGRGADLVVEASGAAAGINSAFQLVRKLGKITAIGLTGKEKIELPYDAGMFKAVEFIFNLSTSYTSWDKAIQLLDSGKIETSPLITHQGGLESWKEFFADLENKKGIKGIFLP
ncbi:MAG: alcohol dehydrogenase catalytic domain-containing protein [Calditrichales bacterium]|nr:alcohol dehydrogenase catalytic domain-containing protein [Calditrichales bacterium]